MLGVIATNIVPNNSVLVDVVEHSQASFGRLVDFELGVVRLRFLKVAGGAPRLSGPAGRFFVGGGQFDARAGPEPAVDDERLEVGTIVAALEVAQSTA